MEENKKVKDEELKAANGGINSSIHGIGNYTFESVSNKFVNEGIIDIVNDPGEFRVVNNLNGNIKTCRCGKDPNCPKCHGTGFYTEREK